MKIDHEAAARLRVPQWHGSLHHDATICATWATDGHVLVAWTAAPTPDADARAVMRGTWPPTAPRWETTLAELRAWAIGTACPHCGHSSDVAPRDGNGKSPGTLAPGWLPIDRLILRLALDVLTGDAPVRVSVSPCGKWMWFVGDGFWVCVALTGDAPVGRAFAGMREVAP